MQIFPCAKGARYDGGVDIPVRKMRTLRGDVGGVLVEGGVFDDYFVVG